jgi:hypothetical protein
MYKDYSHDMDVLAHAKPVYENGPAGSLQPVRYAGIINYRLQPVVILSV